MDLVERGPGLDDPLTATNLDSPTTALLHLGEAELAHVKLERAHGVSKKG
jgi:hypothetical protein